MSRNRMTARGVGSLPPGRHADGGGLYLNVRQHAGSISRHWLFRYRRGKRGAEREVVISLGNAADLSLAAARKLAGECRTALAFGQDPRRLARFRPAPQSFAEAAAAYIDAIEPSLRNAKHVAQWRSTLLGPAYCASLQRVGVDKVTTEHVLAVLKPIWHVVPDTAKRLRGRIERVLDAATVAGQREEGANPARWDGHLQMLLPPPATLSRGHHKALPYPEVPAFLVELRALDSVSARALEFTILTAARTGETVGATWSEIDVERRLWTIPAARMKAKREHRVPLTARCLEILAEVRKLKGRYVFPGRDRTRHLSTMALLECVKGLRPGHATVHGFRSSFRDWIGEATNFPTHIAEAALAHLVGDRTERAYRRGDALDRRRQLMAAWASFCNSDATGRVVPFPGTGSATSGTDGEKQ